MPRRTVLLVLVLLASACSSTNTARPDRRAATGDVVAASPEQPAAPRSSAQPAASGKAAAATKKGGRAATGGGATGGAAAPQVIKGGDPVRMGFIIIDLGGAERILAGYGTQVSFGDGELEAKALVADLNKRGGIGGRKVEGFYARVNPASADPGAAYVAGCTKLTEDDKVFVVITVLNVTQGFVDCVANHKTLLINESFNPGDDHLLAQHKEWVFSPSLMSLDRGTALLLDLLRNHAKLGAGVKMGVVVNDSDPQLPRVFERVVKPTLTSWGVPFSERRVKGQNSSDIAGAVLAFSTEQVNRVMFIAPNGLAQLQFMNMAEDQGYRPLYSFWDPDSPKFVAETAPRAQARNITGLGALPVSDVHPSQYPMTAEEKRCLDILRAAGEPSSDRNSNLASTLYCEAVWAFEAATERVTGPLSAAVWRTSYRALGTSYRPVTTFAVDLGTGRNDNASNYRPIAWSEGCTCMTFTGPSQPAPR